MRHISVQQFPTPLTADQVHRRAGGRRRHNKERRFARDLRRYRVFELYWSLQEAELNAGVLPKLWGLATLIAAHLGVSRSTVCRDLASMPNFALTGPRGAFWPEMGRWRKMHRMARLISEMAISVQEKIKESADARGAHHDNRVERDDQPE
jgi:hypothetical protein